MITKDKANDVRKEVNEMKNSYRFKSWHNGAGEWFRFTVEAVDVDEAYDKAYEIVYNTSGLEPDVELYEASCLQEWEVIAEVAGDKPTTFTIQHFSEDAAMIDAEIWLSEHHVDYEYVYVMHLKEVR